MKGFRVPTRRQVLALTAGAFAAASFPLSLVRASEGARRHGMSIFGELKYPPDFAHFDYVNPDAPKGGTFSQIGPCGALPFRM